MKKLVIVILGISLMLLFAACEDENISSKVESQNSQIVTSSVSSQANSKIVSNTNNNVEEIIYESDDLTISFLGFEEPPYPALGYYINLHIENKSDSDYTVQARDLSVDNIMVPFGNVIFSCDVMAKKTANNHIWITGLEENGIATPITSAEFKFVFIKNHDYVNSELSDIILVE